MGKQSTITKSKASCPLLFYFLIEKGKDLVSKKPRMGTHSSKVQGKNTSKHNPKKNKSKQSTKSGKDTMQR
jgi:hypothetical protein